MTCHVYMIKAGDYCKIGITGRLDSRLRAIKTSNPMEVSLIDSQQYDNNQDALAVEKAIHEHFGFKFGRVRGEWFNYCAKSSHAEFCMLTSGRYSAEAMRSYRDAYEEITNHRNYSEETRLVLSENYWGLEAFSMFRDDLKSTPIIDSTDFRSILDYLNSAEE